MENFDKMTEEKLQRFETEIMDAANHDCEKIDAELAAYKTAVMAKQKAAAKSESRHMVENEAACAIAAANTDLSRKKAKIRETLYETRDSLCAALFEKAADQLKAFAASGEYGPYLLKKAAELAAAYPTKGARISVRSVDLAKTNELERLLPGATIAADDTILLGGLRLESADGRSVADATLDAALLAERELFAARSGFVVTMGV